MANDIVCENSKPGNPDSEWDTNYAGDPTIQGYATDISVAQGGTIFFKVKTDARSYAINIYRLGFYAGNGARKIATVTPSVSLPQTQPACLTDVSTQLYDCGSWAVSGSWQVPSNATSGVYIAHLVRADTGGDSHIVFVVRNDTSHSAMLFQTSDSTWQAYNGYGGPSVYGGDNNFDLPNRAFKVSYNRPIITRGFGIESASFLFGAEYPMIRFLESNGYDVTYFSGVDAARNGQVIKNHQVFLSVGHDEYWSAPQRTNVEAARDAGVNMAFFSGNEIFWKTRWENSIDGTNTAYRTMVCYKETMVGSPYGGLMDPGDPPTWTGTWRDPRFSPPADGGRPENSLSGNLFMVNGTGPDNGGNLSIQVPAADGKMRFWRGTAIASLAPTATYTLPAGTLGYEWDMDVDNNSRPAGTFRLSTATYPLTVNLLLDYGATYGAGSATHHMTMHRAPSGALVFGAGSIQWTWGLDSNHDNPFEDVLPTIPDPDPNMQQGVVNLFADMGIQPGSLQAGLIRASKSTDTVAPSSTLSSPANGSTVNTGHVVTISGTATDTGGGVVAGVEVSFDGGQTWHPANGRGSWTYSWTPTVVGTATIETRAVDDSGNIEVGKPHASVTVAPQNCPCETWSSAPTPSTVDSGDSSSVEVGVKFQSDVNGYVTGIRFYKSTANIGKHVGNLWSNTGSLLGTATFSNETSSGWQQVTFAVPVLVTAGNTYVASYFAPSGHYSADSLYFAISGVDDPPLHILSNTISPNGVYAYGPASLFPSASVGNGTNYWVDVVFAPSTVTVSVPSLSFATQILGTVGTAQPVTFKNIGKSTLIFTGISITGTNSADFKQTNNCGTTLAVNASCTINVTFSPSTGTGVRNANLSINDNAAGSPQVVALTGTATVNQLPGQCPCSIWNMTVVPSVPDGADPTGIEVGVKFTTDQNGLITGIRFYKSALNTGMHIGNLWSTSGTKLATVTFTNEGSSGWQQMNFSTAVAVTANTTYVASYFAPTGHYSANGGNFSTSVDNAPLHALSNGVSPNGVYSYNTASTFPQSSYNATNYWVDVIFTPSIVSISSQSVSFGNQTVGVASTAQALTLSNSGSSSVTLTGITISGTNGADFKQTNTCGTTIAGGAHCTINVTFTPAAAGARTGTLTVTDNAVGGTQTVSLTGTGVVPVAPIDTLSLTSLAFGSQVIATNSAPQAVVLSNTGNAVLNSISIAVTGTNSVDFSQLNTCGATLGVGATCTISVTFSPTTVGTRVANVAITDSATGSPHLVTLTGAGLATPPPPGVCPCSIWNVTATPAVQDSGDASGVELGVKFTSDQSGWVTGIRFFKSSANTGTHIGNLWTSTGALIATVAFTNEASSGWQQMNFSSPVQITANSTYIASYYAPVGHYSVNSIYFATSGVDNAPLHALSNSVSQNGVFSYGTQSSFPQSSYNATNYWVDVIFTPTTVSLSPASLSFNSQVVGTTSSAQPVTLTNTGSSTLALSGITITGANTGDYSQSNNCGTSLAANSQCTINVTFTPSATGSRNATITFADNAFGGAQTLSVVGTGVPAAPPPGVCPCSIWNLTTIPTVQDSGDGSALEIGFKFTSDQNGWVTGIRFYKSAANTGTHIGNLWTSAGVQLATVVFTNESASGWQQMNFSQPVQITANTTYVASYYAPLGHYSYDSGNFSSGIDNPPLHALSNGVSPNGVYAYGPTSSFPQSSYNSTNYWIDVVFTPGTISMAPGSVAFSTQTVGTISTAQPVVLSNAGSASISLSGIAITGANSGDFTQSNNCSASLAAGASCSINVSFRPTTTGPRSASLTVSSSDPASPQSLSLSGTGQ